MSTAVELRIVQKIAEEIGCTLAQVAAAVGLLGWWLMRNRGTLAQEGEVGVAENLDDEALIRAGAGNYNAMCIGCHLAPGVAKTELSQALYPAPPNLSEVGIDGSPAATFWVIKHGIKASGMPAWSKGGMEDEAIWDLTAFLQKMPLLSATAYEQLVAASDGHSHGGLEGHEEAPAAPVEEMPVAKGKNAHSHDHGAHKH